jgi:hypothetical protein
MGEKYIILILVLIILAFAILLKDDILIQDNNLDNPISGKVTKDIPKDENQESDNLGNSNAGFGSGSSEGESSESVEDNENIDYPSLPDIAGAPCGYYYKGYGICNGTCPEGECINEGKSCYCSLPESD